MPLEPGDGDVVIKRGVTEPELAFRLRFEQTVRDHVHEVYTDTRADTWARTSRPWHAPGHTMPAASVVPTVTNGLRRWIWAHPPGHRCCLHQGAVVFSNTVTMAMSLRHAVAGRQPASPGRGLPESSRNPPRHGYRHPTDPGRGVPPGARRLCPGGLCAVRVGLGVASRPEPLLVRALLRPVPGGSRRSLRGAPPDLPRRRPVRGPPGARRERRLAGQSQGCPLAGHVHGLPGVLATTRTLAWGPRSLRRGLRPRLLVEEHRNRAARLPPPVRHPQGGTPPLVVAAGPGPAALRADRRHGARDHAVPGRRGRDVRGATRRQPLGVLAIEAQVIQQYLGMLVWPGNLTALYPEPTLTALSDYRADGARRHARPGHPRSRAPAIETTVPWHRLVLRCPAAREPIVPIRTSSRTIPASSIRRRGGGTRRPPPDEDSRWTFLLVGGTLTAMVFSVSKRRQASRGTTPCACGAPWCPPRVEQAVRSRGAADADRFDARTV